MNGNLIVRYTDENAELQTIDNVCQVDLSNLPSTDYEDDWENVMIIIKKDNVKSQRIIKLKNIMHLMVIQKAQP